ncbi:MAG: J domain-containing protein [Myxococcota bacterium]
MIPAEIQALSRMLDEMDYYRLLRVKPEAPPSQIRAAYHRARREFHPDAHLRSAPELRDSVERVARRITEAYLTLRDPERRTAYDRGLGEGRLRFCAELVEATREESEAARGRSPNGRRFYAMALAQERAGKLAEALSHVKMALTFEPGHTGFEKKCDELQARLKAQKKKA